MNLRLDLTYALRLLDKSRGYSLMCASVVALSVGLAVWTNALMYSQIFKPLPFPDAGRWYSVQIAPEAGSRARPFVDAFTYQEILKRSRSAEHLGAMADKSIVLSEGQASTNLRGGAMTPRLLAAMGVAPLHGRLLQDSDAQQGSAPVAVLSYETWQNYFAADPAIVGKTVRLDAAPARVIGVTPRGFLPFDDYELLVPLQLPNLARPQDSTLIVQPLIVLRDGQSKAAILSEMKSAVDDVNATYPDLFSSARSVALIPAAKMFTHGITPVVTMMALMGVAVLLIGCVNISMVFLARLLERSRELALRTALGASRQRLVRQALLETALIILPGLLAGYALAWMGIRWTHGIDRFMRETLATGRSANLPELRPFDFFVAVAAAIVVWLLSTVIPAMRVARQDAAEVLAGSGKGSTVRGSNRSVALLVGLQVIISCLVLVGCGNVVMAVRREISKPNGLTTSQVLLSTYPTAFDASFAESSQRLRYLENLEAAIESRLPGAEAAFATAAPTRPARVPAAIETRQGADKQGALKLPVTTVSDDYFNLLGVRLRAGRLFDSTDDAGSLKVAIADEKMAARFWPDESPLGKRVQLIDAGRAEWLTIVGVVSNVRGAPYRPDADIGSIYTPLRQAVPPAFHLIVKVPRITPETRSTLRAAAYAADRDLPLHNIQVLDTFVQATKMSSTAMTQALSAIGLVTALLAASGLFGLISRSVAQRTQEVGIRRALGATPWRATSMFLRQGALYLAVGAIGLALGTMAMPALSRAIPNILERVVPVTIAVVVLMAAVIGAASYLPTRRAVALEPGDALRYE